MAYDSAGFQPAVKPALTERAAFAADLAKHANEPYGVKGGKCASVEWAKQVSAGFARSLIDLTL